MKFILKEENQWGLNKYGVFEEMKPVKELPIGLRIRSNGVFDDCNYCVISERDEYGHQETVLASNDYYNIDNISPFKKIEKYIRPYSEKFGIGMYWDDEDFHIYSDHEIETFKKRATEIEEEIRKKEKEAVESYEKAKNSIPVLYPHLTPIKQCKTSKDLYKQEKQNVVVELKKNFPDYKFSIKKDGSDCINIYWTNGPTDAAVKSAIHIFVNHTSDYSGEYRDYTPTVFNEIFGGYKYIFYHREMSPEVKELQSTLAELLPNFSAQEQSQFFERIFNRSTIPTNAINFRIERSETENFDPYLINFDIPEKSTSVNVEVNTNVNLRIVDYSEKSIAVYGDTYDVKHELSKIGGIFRYKLKEGPGWIFAKRKKEKVEELMNRLTGN